MQDNFIKIQDLRNPVLTHAASAWISDMNKMDDLIRLDADSVLRTARQKTGLYDCGAIGAIERLQELIDRSSDATLLGNEESCSLTLPSLRRHQFCSLVRLASVRLRIQDLLRRHPEIHDIQVTKPIIITGLPRSGTTHLQDLIAHDSRLHSLPVWEAHNPVPLMSNADSYADRELRIDRYSKKHQQCKRMLPYADLMDPKGPYDMAEEDSLQLYDFRNPWDFPQSSDSHTYTETEESIAKHYEYMKTVLKALQWTRGHGRWVLKSLTHIRHLGTLLSTFPDATIVLTHRDPLAVLQSEATKDAYLARLFYREVDTSGIFNLWTMRIEEMLASLLRDRYLIPKGSLVEVPFAEYKSEPIEIIKKIYDTANLELTETVCRDMGRFLSDRSRVGRIKYDIRNDFGVEPDAQRSRFSLYLREYPVELEVH